MPPGKVSIHGVVQLASLVALMEPFHGCPLNAERAELVISTTGDLAAVNRLMHPPWVSR